MKRYDEALTPTSTGPSNSTPARSGSSPAAAIPTWVMRRYGKALADFKRGLKLVFGGGASQDRDP